MLTVVEVKGWSTLRKFLALPKEVYKDDPLWVPHLTFQTLILMGSLWERNKGFFLALDGERVVARIGAKVHAYNGEETLHFGFFECLEEYPEAAALLVDRAHQIAPHLAMRGPYHFTLEDPYTGVLVEGHDEPPCFWAAYNPDYYAAYLERAGLHKIQDLWTYRGDWENARLKPIQRRSAKAAELGVTVRTLDPKNRLSEIRKVAATMNVALQDNWGFEEFTNEKIGILYLLSFLFLHPRWLFLAEHKGETVGCCIVLPDYNPWIQETGGRLTFGLLRRLLKHRDRCAHVRAWALGVKPEYRELFAAPALMQTAIEQGREYGTNSTDVSWILESNKAMNAMLLGMGARCNKVHRVVERAPISSISPQG